ncbi:ribosomal RNA processing protein 1 homolog isoform X2 [Culicoides brevitarsis]|uniref:ribosomal RNA processing protein 1 homolog isoform X2 n=1 Tax=Culicoides brevitarsis TaxID=469753 RepID=UPI00307BE6BD
MPAHVKSAPKNKNKSKTKPPSKKMTHKEVIEEPEAAEPIKTKDDAKAIVVEQEIKFARCLAGNDPKVRNRVLKNLKKWLKLRSEGTFAFTDTDFLRLWKGLWYCMWMSDKPLVQEKLAEDLSSLVHCFNDPKVSLQFFGNFLETMCREWFGIDQWRMDKFMMLVRRIFRQVLFKLQEHSWDTELVQLYGAWLDKTIYDETKAPIGLTMHFNDLYLEEISKVTDGNIETSDVHALLEPCVVFFAKSRDLRHIKHATRNIFHKLMFQSELGQDYQEKFEYWKQAGFPCTDLDDLEVNVEVQEDSEQESENEENGEEVEKELDVRAGRVNVVLKELKFDPEEIINLFEKYRFKEFTNSKSRKTIKEMIQKFRRFAAGEFPLGTHKMPTVQDVREKFEDFDPDKKAQELLDYEEELVKNTVYMPPRVKRKMEWKQKHLMNGNGVKNGSDNGWVEENDENELPKKKKKKVEKEETPVKDAKKSKVAKKLKKSENTEEDVDMDQSKKEENAIKLLKKWAKKEKEIEKSEKLSKVAADEEVSTPKKSLVLNPFAAASTSKKQKDKKTPTKSSLKAKNA